MSANTNPGWLLPKMGPDSSAELGPFHREVLDDDPQNFHYELVLDPEPVTFPVAMPVASARWGWLQATAAVLQLLASSLMLASAINMHS